MYNSSNMTIVDKLRPLDMNPLPSDNVKHGTAALHGGHIEDAVSSLRIALNNIAEEDDKTRVIERVSDFNREYELDLDRDIAFAVQATMDDMQLEREAVAVGEEYHRPFPTRMPRFDPEETKESPTWISDSQNVHDAVVSDGLAEQIASAKRETPIIDNYSTIKNALLCDKNKIFFDRIESDCPLLGLNTREQELLVLAWNRKYLHNDPTAIQSAITDGIYDCYENGGVVCPTGRGAKIWGSLAHVDEKYGKLKNKSVLKDEFLTKVAHISATTEDTKEAEDQIRTLAEDYIQLSTITILRDECIAAL
jgi:hypothetical protein